MTHDDPIISDYHVAALKVLVEDSTILLNTHRELRIFSDIEKGLQELETWGFLKRVKDKATNTVIGHTVNGKLVVDLLIACWAEADALRRENTELIHALADLREYLKTHHP